jgi:uncharacterized protein (DUF1800 family)
MHLRIGARTEWHLVAQGCAPSRFENIACPAIPPLPVRTSGPRACNSARNCRRASSARRATSRSTRPHRLRMKERSTAKRATAKTSAPKVRSRARQAPRHCKPANAVFAECRLWLRRYVRRPTTEIALSLACTFIVSSSSDVGERIVRALMRARSK